MPAALSLEGVRFGRLVAVCRVGTASNGSATWECTCDCGTDTIVPAGDLRSGHTQSCGCLHRETRVLNGKASRHAVVTYHSAHERVYRAQGKAAEHTCPCGAPAREWAYSNVDPDERTETDGRKGSMSLLAYSLDPSYYVAMCVPCHKRLDATYRIGVLACL